MTPSRIAFIDSALALGVVDVMVKDRGVTVTVADPDQRRAVEQLAREAGLTVKPSADLREVRVFGFPRQGGRS